MAGWLAYTSTIQYCGARVCTDTLPTSVKNNLLVGVCLPLGDALPR